MPPRTIVGNQGTIRKTPSGMRRQPTKNTAQLKAADGRRKAEEELQRRIAEVQKHTSTFLQGCIDEEKAREKKHATAAAQDAKGPDKEMQNEKNAGSYDFEAGRIDRRPCKVPGCRCMLSERRELTADEEKFLHEKCIEIDYKWIRMIHGHDSDSDSDA